MWYDPLTVWPKITSRAVMLAKSIARFARADGSNATRFCVGGNGIQSTIVIVLRISVEKHLPSFGARTYVFPHLLGEGGIGTVRYDKQCHLVLQRGLQTALLERRNELLRTEPFSGILHRMQIHLLAVSIRWSVSGTTISMATLAGDLFRALATIHILTVGRVVLYWSGN